MALMSMTSCTSNGRHNVLFEHNHKLGGEDYEGITAFSVFLTKSYCLTSEDLEHEAIITLTE